jgi:hypothetical protein
MKTRPSIKFVGFLVYRCDSDEYLMEMKINKNFHVESYTKVVESAYIIPSLEFAEMVASKLLGLCMVVPLYETKKKYIVAFPTVSVEDHAEGGVFSGL